MFRITKVFENKATYLFRIEGKVTDDLVSFWAEEIQNIKNSVDRDLILDFFGVWFISSKAIEILVQSAGNGLYLLNCPIEVRNVFYSIGLSEKML